MEGRIQIFLTSISFIIFTSLDQHKIYTKPILSYDYQPDEIFSKSSFQFAESLQASTKNYSQLIEQQYSNRNHSNTHDKNISDSNSSTEQKEEIFRNFQKIFPNSENSEYDIENRFILRNIIQENEEIISFEILNHKPLIKNDNGIFSYHIIYLLTSKGRKLKFYDTFSNLILEKEFDYDIDKITNFKNQDETHFYAITDNWRMLRKYKLSFRKSENIIHNLNYEHEQFPQNITIRPSKGYASTYNISLNYKHNLQRFKWSIEETARFNLTEFENCIDSAKFDKNYVNTFISKGSKILTINCPEDTIILLNEDLVKIQAYSTLYKNKLNSVKNFQNFLTYVSFMDNQRDSLIFHPLTNLNKTNLICSIDKHFNSGIVAYTFDSFSDQLYVLLESGKLLVTNLNSLNSLVTKTNLEENYCLFLKELDLNESFTNFGLNFSLNNYSNTEMFIFRKDLVILRGNRIISVNLNNVEKFNNIIHKNEERNNFSNGINYQEILIDGVMTNSISDLSEYQISYAKNNYGGILLIQTNTFHIHQYDLLIPHAKIKGGKDDSFKINFKLPLILISLVAIFLYNFIKNTQKDSNEYVINKTDLLEEINKFKDNSRTKLEKNSLRSQDLNSDNPFNHDDNSSNQRSEDSESEFDPDNIQEFLKQKKEN